MNPPGMIAARKPIRTLGLSVFNPDNSSDEEEVPRVVPTPQPPYQRQPLPPSVSSISISTNTSQPSPQYSAAARAISPTTRNYVSSPSSRSSPAPDTTPPPTTPSSTAPSLAFPPAEDKPSRNSDGLGLSVADQSDSEYITYPTATIRPRIENEQNGIRRPTVRVVFSPRP
jgi:hypothetical protein